MKALPAPASRRPAPIPLRPDVGAVHDASMRALVRSAIAIGFNGIEPSTLPGDFLRKNWPSDRDALLVLRAAVAPASTTSTPALAAVSHAFLSALTPMSAGADLLNRGLSLRFDGAASISVPNIALPVARFVGEGMPIPLSQASTEPGLRLERHKVACIVPLSNELLRSPQAEDLIKQTLIEATGPALDRVLFSANPASPESPPGLLHGIAALAPAANLVDNLVQVLEAISSVSGNGAVAVITTPKLRVAIDLMLPKSPPFIVLASSSLPTGAVVAVALNALVSAVEGPPLLDASAQALVHSETQAEHINLLGNMVVPVRSFFQSDTVGLRLRWALSWGVRSSQGVAWTVT